MDLLNQLINSNDRNKLAKEMTGDVNARNYVIYILKAMVVRKNVIAYLPLITTLLESEYPKDTSRDVIYSNLRTIIKKTFGIDSNEYNESLKLMKLSTFDKGKVFKNAKDKVIESNKEVVLINYKEIVNKLKEIIINKNPLDLLALLLLACGARVNEFFNSEFEQRDGLLFQSFVSKKSNPELGITRKIILVSPGMFIKLRKFTIKMLKLEFPDLYQSKTLSVKANKRIKELFGPNTTLHTMRAWYAVISHHLYARSENLNTYISRVLGHEGLSASFNYSGYKVI